MSNKASIVKTEPLEDREAKWVSLERITWRDRKGQERQWESTKRRTREDSECDAIIIFPILRSTKVHGTRTILTRQFRPPTGKVCVEFPAGLVDPSEPVEKTALRELREETGYVGQVRSLAPISFSDPGMSNANLRLAIVDVNEDGEENAHPKPQLDEGEDIEIDLVPLDGLVQTLAEYGEKGNSIDSRLQAIAYGLALAPQLTPPE
ncbi:MAG: NUDIX hydrolase domain-like protein [Piptocephalis tieghemiana]|nr:MAG: NUDIX hydrolase domain-like protein [Piptocephalis tieghemiana]